MSWRERLGERRFFRSFDGEELYFHQKGQGVPILLLNGFVCSTHYWPEVVDFFAQTHTVLSWDYRGYGENKTPADLTSIELTSFAHDVAALLDVYGARDAILMGHSMGVQLGFECFRRYPQRVKALVTICGTFENPFASLSPAPQLRGVLAGIAKGLRPHSKVVAMTLKPLLRSRLALALAYQVGANAQLLPRHYLESLFRHVCAMDFSVAIRSFEAMVRHSARDVLEEIDVPTLIIGGEHDEMTPPERSQEIHQAIAGSECQIYKDCTHLAMLEKQEEVLGDIAAFFTRHQLV